MSLPQNEPPFPVSRDVLHDALIFLLWFVVVLGCVLLEYAENILVKRPSYFLQKNIPHGLVLELCGFLHWFESYRSTFPQAAVE